MRKTSSFLPILLIGTYAIMCLCFGRFPSVVGASSLNTIPPPITDFFIPVNQRSVEPVRNPGDFIGRLYAPNPIDWKTRSEARPITGATVTIVSGSRSGESITTDQSGYYLFPNVDGDALHLLVEKEHFEPKEVIVSRFHPTKLASGAVLNYHEDVQQHPGNILLGQRWPDEVRFIFEETLVVRDLLYIEAGRPPKVDMGGFYSRGVIVIYRNKYADGINTVGVLGLFAHEIAHAHQHATVSIDGSAWEIHGWRDTPEGIAFAEARRKDWQEVGRAPYDDIYGRREGRGGIGITETAAETYAHYWSVDRWGGRTSYGFLEIEAPNRYKWAEEWVPISIDVRLSPKVVSIPDRNLAKAVRKALGFGTNVPITERWMQRLIHLDARDTQIKNLTGLEHATKLRQLELRNNQIHDITPLANLKSLTDLILDNNRVSNISPLINLTQLRWLLIGGNPISDFTPLKHLTQLRGFALWNSNLSDTTLLAHMPHLTHLWMGNNKISDITPLAHLRQLEILELRNNSIRDIRPLAGLMKLRDIKLDGNPIQDTSPLRTLKARNPNLKLDIEIPPPAPVVLREAAQRPPVYWGDAQTGTLHRLIGDDVENLLPTVKNATSLAIDMAGGKLYWTEITGKRRGRIRRARFDGTPNVQLVKNLTSVPQSLALDAVNGKLYLTNTWGKVQRLNVDGSNFKPNLITGLNAPQSLVIDRTGGKLYWTEKTSDTTGKIRRANLDGTDIQLVKSLTSVPHGIALDTAKRKVYLTNAWGKIQRMNVDGLNFKPNLITGLDSPKGITLDIANSKIYWTEQNSIRRANLNGKNIQNVVTGLRSPASFVLSIPAVGAPARAAPATVVSVPDETDLYPNYPNPFNPETWLPYKLATDTDVWITIYNAQGVVVRVLSLGHQSAGYYIRQSRAAYWDGRNTLGETVASGVFFYQLETDEISSLRKMVILK